MKTFLKPAAAALLAAMLLLSLAPGAAEALPPVESASPNTSYPPAFPGQTRAPGMKTQTPYRVDVLTDGLSAPWGMAALPDGRLLITEKRGSLRIYARDTGLSDPIPGITGVSNKGQGGLLDVLLAPDFASSRRIYLTLAAAENDLSLTALATATLAPDESAVTGYEILWRAGPAYHVDAHFGSRVALSPDGFLFVSTGDRQNMDTRHRAQELSSAYGSIVRLTLDGQPAPGNPYADTPGALPELWSIGHRNVQGLAVHPVTGQLYASEMGPRGGDELNLITPGTNYGWPIITYGIEYSGHQVGQGLTIQEGMAQPLYYWDPVLSPSGMAFYAGDAIPEWQHDLFLCGLNSSHIARLKLENGRVIGEERLLTGLGQRFRAITEGTDGALYAVTDQGRLYRIGP